MVQSEREVDAGFRGVPLAQDSNVFQRQAEARLQFGVIDVDEPLAGSFLTWIVAGSNQPADEPRPRHGRGR